MTIKKAYHVVVIGGGITGLSVALHLKKSGLSRIAIAQRGSLGSPSRLAAGFSSGGQLDNFTRLTHLYGTDLARKLWQFGDQAFDALISYAKDHHVHLAQNRRVRFLTSQAELHEAKIATSQMMSSGLNDTRLFEKRNGLHDRILGIQDDGNRGAFIDADSLFESLRISTSNVPRLPFVTKICLEHGSLAIHLASGIKIQSEIVVVAAHIETGALIPELAPALVPFTDQWTEFSFDPESLPSWCAPGLVFTTNHTHEWGVIMGHDKLRFGGGRYLRPLAGIECPNPSVNTNIIRHLEKQLSHTFPKLHPDNCKKISSFGMVDLKPCDELPIIGPMFGEPRILVSTGYGGQGPQMGFYAGSQLAELICRGVAPHLPRSLWPERLRSLPQ